MMTNVLIGVDLGGTSTKLAFIDENGHFLNKWEIETDKRDSGKYILLNIVNSISEKVKELKIEREQLIGIGIGVPGPVNFETGLVYQCVNLGWGETQVKEILEKETGIPVVVDNDANVAAIGEMWKGAGKGTKNMICVTLGTGIGGGVIMDGNIVHGVKGAGGEIGHIVSVMNDGFTCNCGKKGCLETVASASGISRLAIEAVRKTKRDSKLKEWYEKRNQLTAKDVFDALHEGDQLAEEIVENVTKDLGVALANIGSLLNPEKIVIGGGVSAAGNALLAPLNRHFNQYTFSTVRISTMLVLATLGNDAGVIGGAYLAKTYGGHIRKIKHNSYIKELT